MPDVVLTTWPDSNPPARSDLERVFGREGLWPTWWSNGPGDVYGAHSHPYHKVLFCAAGDITFRLEDRGEDFELHAGDRLDIPPSTVHSARVGRTGVTCVEAARR